MGVQQGARPIPAGMPATRIPVGRPVLRGQSSVMRSLPPVLARAGSSAIGHTRYSTAGGSKLVAAQPFVLETDLGQLAIAHNGQVARAAELRRAVLGAGVGLFTNSDSEVIAQMLARPHDRDLAERLLREDRSRKASIASAAELPHGLRGVTGTPPRPSTAPSGATLASTAAARLAGFVLDDGAAAAGGADRTVRACAPASLATEAGEREGCGPSPAKPARCALSPERAVKPLPPLPHPPRACSLRRRPAPQRLSPQRPAAALLAGASPLFGAMRGPPAEPLWPAWVARIAAFMRECEVRRRRRPGRYEWRVHAAGSLGCGVNERPALPGASIAHCVHTDTISRVR